MRVRAPASSANLGPGFDTLAVALCQYVEVAVSPTHRLTVTSAGYGSEYPTDGTHLAVKVACEVAGTDRLAIDVWSDIPVGRGLGSSAALAVAAAAAAGAKDPLAYGAAADGHPENAAASALGGLIAATTVHGQAVARRLPLDPVLRFVLVVPERALPTAEARRALPAAIDHDDAAFNLGRMGILIAGLADHRQLIGAATEDRLHQPFRSELFPEAAEIMAAMIDGGALATCWSGAGPSLLAVSTALDAPGVEQAADVVLEALGVAASVRTLTPDLGGITLLDDGDH